MKVTIKEIIDTIESAFPPSLCESWDNVGLLVGDADRVVEKALIALDFTEAVLEEAIAVNAGMIITHHPALFKAVKNITTINPTTRLLFKAIQKDVALYAAHTNMDNHQEGINKLLADKLGLLGCAILQPQEGKLYKVVTFVPESHSEAVSRALFQAGAGYIGNYDCCSFSSDGVGTFRPLEGSNPFYGKRGALTGVSEKRVEVIVPEERLRKTISSLRMSHPYEEPAFDIIQLHNEYKEAGSGMIGSLAEPMPPVDFLHFVKHQIGAPLLRYSQHSHKKIKSVAICGGSGAFLIETALRRDADAFITGDLKYHDFFVPNHKMLLIDAGHYETEQFFRFHIYNLLKGKFYNFAPQISEAAENAVRYLL